MRSPESALNSPKLDQPCVLGNASLGQGDAIARHPIQRRGRAGRPGQHGDAPVSQGDQVADQRACAGKRVADDAVDVPAGDLAVDDDGRRVAGAQPRQVLGVGAERGDHHAVDALADHHVEIAELLGGVFVGVAEEDGVAVALGCILDATGDRGPKGVLDVRHESAPSELVRLERRLWATPLGT